MSIGGFAETTLEQARARALELRAKLKSGIDPLAERLATRNGQAATRAKLVTFDQCAAKYIEAHRAGWANPKHAQQWENTLATYASPQFGALPVSEVDTGLVLACLEPIWTTKTETASRLRGRIEQILDWATVRGYRQGENPSRWRGHLDKLLVKKSKVLNRQNQPALPYPKAGAFLAELRKVEGFGARALELAILCASRSNEVRGAVWSEFDLKARTWVIPAERMKMKREHRVPLSSAAVKLLDALPRLGGTDLVFPGFGGAPMSDATLNAVIRRMHDRKHEADSTGWIEPSSGRQIVQHGFRSTFRDWSAERTSYPRELAELQLAHAAKGSVEAAYFRSDLFEKRRRLMDEWAAFIAQPETAADNVVELRAAS
jgi:integrase